MLTLWQGTKALLEIDDPDGKYAAGQIGFGVEADKAAAGALFTQLQVSTP